MLSCWAALLLAYRQQTMATDIDGVVAQLDLNVIDQNTDSPSLGKSKSP